MSDYLSIINVLSGIGTFFAAIISMIALKEIKKQRESTYIPDVFLSDYLVFVNFDNTTKNFIYSTLDSEKNIIHETHWKIKIPIFNFGLGVAKRIKYKWTIDVDSLISFFNSMNNDTEEHDFRHKVDSDFYLKKEKNGIDDNDGIRIYSEKHGVHDYCTIDFDDSKQNYISYILPDKSLSNCIAIPEVYCSIVSWYIYSKYYFDKSPNINEYGCFRLPEGKLPDLSLKIEYYDLNNKKYIKEFSLNFEPSYNYYGLGIKQKKMYEINLTSK